MWGSGFGHRPRGPSASASLTRSSGDYWANSVDATMFVFFSAPVDLLCIAVTFIAVMAGMLAAAPE